jgi:hypothetical protein
MKKALIAFGMLLMTASAANAGGLVTKHASSVQLTVEGPAVQSTRIGHSMSISGNNVNTTDGTTSGIVGNAIGMSSDGFTAASSTITATQATAGEAFSFSASYTQGDALVTSQTQLSNAGRFDTPNLYGNSTTQAGGYAGSLAGTIDSSHTMSLTAGGSGSTATGQFITEITALD